MSPKPCATAFEAMHNAFETKCPMSESTYRTMEMKDIARILRLAVWRSHAVAVVATVVSMLAAIAPAAHAKDISPMEAVRIARRVVTLSDDCAAKARAQSRTATPISPYHIYNETKKENQLPGDQGVFCKMQGRYHKCDAKSRRLSPL